MPSFDEGKTIKKTIKKMKPKKSTKYLNEFSNTVINYIKTISFFNREHFFNENIVDNKYVFEKFIMHLINEKERYRLLNQLYIGDLLIYNIPLSSDHIDERIGCNFAKILVQDLNGYLLGSISISYKDNDKINTYIQEYMDKVDFIQKIKELCIKSSVYGKAYVRFYWDAEKEIPNFVINTPKNLLLVKDDIIGEKNILAIYNSKTSTIDEQGNIEPIQFNVIYTKDNIYHQIEKSDKNVFKKISRNYFKYLGILELKENDLSQAVFEPCLSLIMDYNKQLSDVASDYSYFSNSYMTFSGEELNADDMYNFRRERIINFSKSDSKASFLTKPDTYATKRLFLNDLIDRIYDNSNVINLSDDNFGDKSGIGTKYRLIRMNCTVKQKRMNLIKIIKNIFDIIASFKKDTNKGDELNKFNKDKLVIDIKTNLPNNLVENADVVSKVGAILPLEEQINLLGITDDPKHVAIEKRKEDKESMNDDIRETFEGFNSSKQPQGPQPIEMAKSTDKDVRNNYDENGNLMEKH